MSSDGGRDGTADVVADGDGPFDAARGELVLGDGQARERDLPAPPRPDLGGTCPAAAACRDQVVDCSKILQACIDQTPPGGVLELTAGRYHLASTQLQIGKPMTLRTAGSAGKPPCPVSGAGCAELFALPGFGQSLGLLVVKAAAVVDHLVLNGNRQGRGASAAYTQCKNGNNSYGFNGATSCSHCKFTNSVSKNALCGTGLQVGVGSFITVSNSTFAANGVHNQQNLWADGLTVHDADDSVFTSNTLVDNTDVDFIFGGCRRCKILDNTISHGPDLAAGSFAALMIHKWPTTSGCYVDVEVKGNKVDCGPARTCGSGLYIGSESWYPETPYGTLTVGTTSGVITGNSVVNTMNGLYIAAQGLTIYGNGVLNAHGIAIPNSCHKSMVSVTPYVVSPTAKSIHFMGENVDPVMKVHFSNADWSGCIPNWPF
jgi:hypothetical protein